jgi:hypothetical protein
MYVSPIIFFGFTYLLESQENILNWDYTDIFSQISNILYKILSTYDGYPVIIITLLLIIFLFFDKNQENEDQ